MTIKVFGNESEFALTVRDVRHDGNWIYGYAVMLIRGVSVGDETQLVSLNTCYPHICRFLSNWEKNFFPHLSNLRIDQLFHFFYLRMFDSSPKTEADYLTLSSYRELCHLDDLFGAAMWDSHRTMIVRVVKDEAILIWQELDSELISHAVIPERIVISAFEQYREFIQHELEQH